MPERTKVDDGILMGFLWLKRKYQPWLFNNSAVGGYICNHCSALATPDPNEKTVDFIKRRDTLHTEDCDYRRNVLSVVESVCDLLMEASDA